MKCFSILDILKELQGIDYSFTDGSKVTFNVDDFINYTRWRSANIPTFDNNQILYNNNIDSFNRLFKQFNLETKDNFSRIKDALGLTYEVLDNYNGIIESTNTETLNHSDVLTFNNRSDVRNLNYNDSRTVENTDIQTLNTKERNESDSNNPNTVTVSQSENKESSHYTTGYNSTSPIIESKDITSGNKDGNQNISVESGARNLINTGTVSNTSSGEDTVEHTGTITDSKAGSENTLHSGTITTSFKESKHGNLGVTTSQQMLTSEIELRLRYKLKPMIIRAFIDEFFFI